MRKTKAFSFEQRDDIWFKRNAREARKEGRSESQQIIFVLREYFMRKSMLREIEKEKSDGR